VTIYNTFFINWYEDFIGFFKKKSWEINIVRIHLSIHKQILSFDDHRLLSSSFTSAFHQHLSISHFAFTDHALSHVGWINAKKFGISCHSLVMSFHFMNKTGKEGYTLALPIPNIRVFVYAHVWIVWLN
jgi:hypothetical protein